MFVKENRNRKKKKKIDTTHPSRISQSGISCAKLRYYSQDLWPCWKYSVSVGITNFSKNHQVQSFFMTPGLSIFSFIDPGGIIWNRGGTCSKNNRPGKPPGHISMGHLDRVLLWSLYKIRKVLLWILFIRSFILLLRNTHTNGKYPNRKNMKVFIFTLCWPKFI